jgi:hypothetical protein
MRTLIRTGSTVAWLGLVALTLISWFLGTDHRFNSANHAGASVADLRRRGLQAASVGMYFMELRGAPRGLRAIFEGYCAALLVLLIGMYFRP